MSKPKYSVVIIKSTGERTERYYKDLNNSLIYSRIARGQDPDGKNLLQIRAHDCILRSYVGQNYKSEHDKRN